MGTWAEVAASKLKRRKEAAAGEQPFPRTWSRGPNEAWRGSQRLTSRPPSWKTGGTIPSSTLCKRYLFLVEKSQLGL